MVSCGVTWLFCFFGVGFVRLGTARPPPPPHLFVLNLPFACVLLARYSFICEKTYALENLIIFVRLAEERSLRVCFSLDTNVRRPTRLVGP